jgi:hypothetical protein
MNFEFDQQQPTKKRKNFSKNNTGKRRAGDFYETPYSMTRQLFDVEWFSTGEIVLEPACGDGAITRVMSDLGFGVISTDLSLGDDFLTFDDRVAYIVTNPPFSMAFEFVQKAKARCDVKFAFLLPLDYLHGLERFEHNIFEGLANVWVFVRRPMLGDPLRPDGKYRTGMQTYAWFVWDRGHRGPPQIGWIDNREFVLNARDM